MQYTYISRLYKATYHHGWSFFIKVFVFLITGLFLFNVLSLHALPKAVEIGKSIFQSTGNIYLLLSTVLLLPFNWLMEAMKWHALVRKTEVSSLSSSYKGILSGITLGFLTPHGIGDYFGRILQLEGKKRMQCLGYIFLTRVTQLHATLFFGGIAIVYLLLESQLHIYIVLAITIFIGAANILLFLFLFSNRRIVKTLKRLPWAGKLYFYLALIGKVSFLEMFKIISYSYIRYLIFALQFLLLLYYFKVPGSFLHLSMGIAFVFLVKSIFPTFFELGVREAAAIYFFSEVLNSQTIISASISLWLINIVTPAIIGLFLVPKMKLFLPE